MKLIFNFQIQDLSGNPIEGEQGRAGKILGQMLSSQNKGDSVKLFDWALKIWNGKEIEIDNTDCDVLIGLIESTELLTVLAKVPLINYVKSVKEKK